MQSAYSTALADRLPDLKGGRINIPIKAILLDRAKFIIWRFSRPKIENAERIKHFYDGHAYVSIGMRGPLL